MARLTAEKAENHMFSELAGARVLFFCRNRAVQRLSRFPTGR